MPRLLALLLALLLAPAACGRKKAPPPPAPVQTPPPAAPTAPMVNAPPGVPAELRRLIEQEWPGIAKEGAAFLEKFKEAQNAQNAGDRATMDVAIEAANQHFEAANGRWAEVYYWAENQLADGAIDEATAEVCRKFLSDYNTRVNEWVKKNKTLKEFSRVK